MAVVAVELIALNNVFGVVHGLYHITVGLHRALLAPAQFGDLGLQPEQGHVEAGVASTGAVADHFTFQYRQPGVGVVLFELPGRVEAHEPPPTTATSTLMDSCNAGWGT